MYTAGRYYSVHLYRIYNIVKRLEEKMGCITMRTISLWVCRTEWTSRIEAIKLCFHLGPIMSPVSGTLCKGKLSGYIR
jgi:hypothetical protein